MTPPIIVRDHPDAAAFDAAVGAWLARREAEHALMLGLMGGLRSGRRYGDPPRFYALHDARGIVGAALRTPPYNLLLSLLTAEGADALADHLAGVPGGTLPGVNGPRASAERFARRWCARRGGSRREAMALRLYRLDEVRHAADVPGRLRLATRDNGPLLRRYFDGFQSDAGLSVREPPEGLVQRYLAGAGTGLALWEDDGAVRSMAGWSGPTPHGVRVSAVYTPPDQRRRGYAGALVAALCRRLLAEGRAFVTLYTDLANPTSNHVYRAVGFEPLLDTVEIAFEASDRT